MPYCPKCDMEFIDGITVCSNCGGSLAEFSKSSAVADTVDEDGADEDSSTDDSTDEGGAADETVRIYINKEQKHEDLKSSASAFYIVGIIVTAVSILCWIGKIDLPMHGIYKMIFLLATTIIGIFSLVVAVKSTAAAWKLAPQIEDENQATQNLIQWFTDTYSGDDIDQAIDGAAVIAPEELSLKRFSLIQDYLITNHDLPDPSYVDALCEEIYSKLYESS